MSMRITNNIIIARNLRNQNNNLFNMNSISENIESTVSLHRPSDDPVKVSRVLRLESDLRLNAQYKENIGTANSWLSMTDGSLDEITKVLQRARELATQGSNDTYSPEDKQKIQQEITQLKDHIVTVANQTYTGRYIFSGFRTNVPLLKSDGSFNTSATPTNGEIETKALPGQNIELFIGDQQKMSINITGDKVFRPQLTDPTKPLNNDDTSPDYNPYDYTKPPKIMQDLDNLMARLFPSDGSKPDAKEITKSIGDMDMNLKNILETRGEVGAKIKTIEVIEDRMNDDNLNLKKLLSDTRDTNMAEAYTQLMTSEAVYRASLAVAGRIIQPTLVDFLR